MDEMNIQSSWTKAIIAKIVKKILKGKIGIDPDIDLGDVYLRIGDEKIEVAFSGRAMVNKSEVYELLKKNLF